MIHHKPMNLIPVEVRVYKKNQKPQSHNINLSRVPCVGENVVLLIEESRETLKITSVEHYPIYDTTKPIATIHVIPTPF
jgi:hypothetical protein